jgi:spore coat polysaccharide biosynthesis protein SpsF
MKVLGLIQARMGSSRLPGKVLMPLAGEPMLARVVERLRRATRLDEVVVATTVEPADEAVAQLCQARGWPCFRGSQDDVLDRFYRAGREHGADVIVRVTADCPLIEPAVVDRVVQAYLDAKDADLVSNVWPRRTFPRGLDTEVVRWAALERAWREDDNPAWREHVTAFIYRRPDLFRVANVENAQDFSAGRWTVDTADDLALVRAVYDHFGHDRFGWEQTLRLLDQHPEWTALNRHIEQKEV